jgi:Domain of unknown function (DUF4262)
MCTMQDSQDHADADRDANVRRDVAEFGCHVSVLTDPRGEPVCAFTIGLVTTYGHPEIVVFGLPPEVAVGLLEALEEDLEDGTRFATDRRYDNLLRGYACMFRPVHPDNVGMFEAAVRYHGGRDFPILQVFWPDRQGRFPWEAGVRDGFRQLQPVLADAMGSGPA